MSHIRTLEDVISQVRIPFRPKHDPSRNLAEEIESCKRKIWECIDSAERKQYFEKKQKKNEEQDGKIESNKENSKNSANNPKQIEESNKVIQKAKKNKSQPPLTRTDIELKVFVMKVVELKKELKARGQDTAGLKKDLRNRLINGILEDYQRKEKETLSAQNKLYCASYSVIVEESQEEQKESSDSMDVSKDSREKGGTVEENISNRLLPIDNDEISRESQRKESVSSMQVEHHSEAIRQVKETKKGNFTDPVSSDQKNEHELNRQQISVPKGALKMPENSLTAIREIDAGSSDSTSAQVSNGSSMYHSNSQEDKSELTELQINFFSDNKKGSDVRGDVSGPPSEVSCSSKTSGNSVKDMVSKFSGFSSSLSSSSSGSALSKGLQAKKEARQAKIAEMRAKAQSKPVTATKVALTSKEYSSTLSSLNATASTASAKKKNLATQMREKAAARAFQNKITNSVSKTGLSKCHLPLTNNSNNSNNTVPDSLGATLKQPRLIKKPSKVLSPMDTYEISDREDSETDDSDSESENEKPKKKIPTWAQRANLYSALEEQYNGRIGSVKVDPDDIFPEVQSCDLEAIFGPKKSKLYKRRASSGNWVNDQVTVAEKLVYKREMGFATDA